ncbi:Hypothetical protein FKW44_015394 [Caligus rogercresseyi]|uniref:Uncharacterized protein n=1 Tax=Caligus rogercresseyi TaxID=217165 RepID=A0A7T8K0E4_CALRO|nr:Hypothetical protein FKW44_015394 [Caligus rogercresseyi]
MERQCGKVDYRLKKLGTLNAVSRSIILQKPGAEEWTGSILQRIQGSSPGEKRGRAQLD